MAQTVSTVNNGFMELIKRIELNDSRIKLASQHYNAVKERIETTLPGKTVSQIGSFQRKTKIRPIKDSDPLDVDLIVCFGDAYRYADLGKGTTPQQALESVRKALVSDGTYKIMAPKSDAPVVVLEYSDGFLVELTPCFRDLTGKYPRQGGPACYIVGTSGGSWLPADYDYDASIISSINQLDATKLSFIPSIKMIKAFLRGKNIPLKSFHIEILCVYIIAPALIEWQQKEWGFNHVLAHFLSKAHTMLIEPISMPESHSPPIVSELSAFHLKKLRYTLTELGSQAWDICKESNDSKALCRWRNFIGEPFPS